MLKKDLDDAMKKKYPFPELHLTDLNLEELNVVELDPVNLEYRNSDRE